MKYYKPPLGQKMAARTHYYLSNLSKERKHCEIFRQFRFYRQSDKNTGNEDEMVINYTCENKICDLPKVFGQIKIEIGNDNLANVMEDIADDIRDNQDDYLPHIAGGYKIISGPFSLKLKRRDAPADSSIGCIYISSLTGPPIALSDITKFL